MNQEFVFGWAAGTALCVSLLTTWLVRRLAPGWGLLDVPNQRSSHSRPVPRGGGIGLLCGVVAGFLVANALSPGGNRDAATLLLASAPIAAAGLIDDLKSLRAGLRLLVQVACASFFVGFLGDFDRFLAPLPGSFAGALAYVAAVIWMVAVANFFNFMDGSDGLATGQAILTCLGVVLAGWSITGSILAWVIAGAALGFLLHNWSPARIFLGDVGSETLGFLLAGLPLLAAPQARLRALLAVAVGLALFLFDPVATLFLRFRRRAPLGHSHREHFYQRLLTPGLSHGSLAGGLIAAGAVLAVAGALSFRYPRFLLPAIALAVLVFGAETSLATGGRLTRYVLIFLTDAFLILTSLYLAFLIRFEGRIPPQFERALADFILVLVPLRLILNLVFGLHRWSFRLSGSHEAVRLLLAMIFGTSCFAAWFYFYPGVGPPRSVIALEFFLTSTALAVFRFAPRLASGWYVDQRRSRSGEHDRTIIVGAGNCGDLLLRDLQRVDDDKRKIGTYLGGRPVLGAIESLPEFVSRLQATQVLIAIPRLLPERIRTILRLCSSLQVQFKIMPVSFSYLHDHVTASMLHELSPEDLLSRGTAAFEADEFRRVLSGRRLLVTGAAGSIGSEIARQVAAFEPESLVLTDINENELYFLHRYLSRKHPGLDLHAEIGDIRDESRLLHLGRRYRPEVVFHAAAHKHVPLMEDAPEEAVKNNVFGTWNAAQMAIRSGADRFVLVSTDKAVRPSSIMGATKRVAELIVRELARREATHFVAVRFGNVLGSAGSVVPLFKTQIARGGPVTVTHPDCRRYFMTVSEAVSLVILAGLGDYGDLCLLEMGEPIRILDLANHMITMAGLVPGKDIRIEFTGLRPGEKLNEELMTEEEEHTQVVRNRIWSAVSPPPPSDLIERLVDLRLAAQAGVRERIAAELRALVPTFEVCHPEEDLSIVQPPRVEAGVSAVIRGAF
jgi:FlaA1/EpsC-like NDP-sugar epimerase/UDP-N-acetylmuramyl pentapeptide phosphotransferase/UDP-N-acetylglucosamine-1-phosphate transferase